MLPIFTMLAKCRFLRGTVLDLFGYTAERKMERSLITDYQSMIDQLLPDLCSANRDLFLEIATLPLSVKGYGHVKQAAYQNYRETWHNCCSSGPANPPNGRPDGAVINCESPLHSYQHPLGKFPHRGG